MLGESSEYGLLVSFPDQSETFTLGVEAGMFWQRIESGETEFLFTAHESNVAVLGLMASAAGLRIAFEDAGVEGWTLASVEGQQAKGPQLRLIKGGLTK